MRQAWCQLDLDYVTAFEEDFNLWSIPILSFCILIRVRLFLTRLYHDLPRLYHDLPRQQRRLHPTEASKCFQHIVTNEKRQPALRLTQKEIRTTHLCTQLFQTLTKSTSGKMSQ